MKKIWLIRHGETEGNRERRYLGITDEPLNKAGRRQAELLYLPKVGAVYTSPMKRCTETAAILFPDVKPIVCQNLRECHFGVFEGKTAEEMAEEPRYLRWVETGCTEDIPGGESVSDFKERCCAAFTAAVADSSAAKMAFVIHGGCIMAILERFEGSRSFYEYHIGNGKAVLCQMDDNGRLHISGGILC